MQSWSWRIEFNELNCSVEFFRVLELFIFRISHFGWRILPKFAPDDSASSANLPGHLCVPGEELEKNQLKLIKSIDVLMSCGDVAFLSEFLKESGRGMRHYITQEDLQNLQPPEAEADHSECLKFDFRYVVDMSKKPFVIEMWLKFAGAVALLILAGSTGIDPHSSRCSHFFGGTSEHHFVQMEATPRWAVKNRERSLNRIVCLCSKPSYVGYRFNSTHISNIHSWPFLAYNSWKLTGLFYSWNAARVGRRMRTLEPRCLKNA